MLGESIYVMIDISYFIEIRNWQYVYQMYCGKNNEAPESSYFFMKIKEFWEFNKSCFEGHSIKTKHIEQC